MDRIGGFSVKWGLVVVEASSFMPEMLIGSWETRGRGVVRERDGMGGFTQPGKQCSAPVPVPVPDALPIIVARALRGPVTLTVSRDPRVYMVV